ncbi:MAG: hypothetical protein ACI4RN_02505 [Oscillospiraceae bacterium]
MAVIKKILCIAGILTVLLSAVSCGGKKNDDSSKAPQSSVSESSEADSSEIKEYQPGKLLANAAKIFQSKKYTLKCTVTDDNSKDSTKITKVVNGDDVYQIQETKQGSYGIISSDGKEYAFDNLCGMYKKEKDIFKNSIVEEIINNKIPPTESNEAQTQDDELYDSEHYTYTGDTYITNVTFYFDKKTGDLKKYTMRYTVEGNDDVVETRTIDSITQDVDEKAFSLDFLDKMVDFEDMSDEQRQGFCQGVCSAKHITVDMMNKLGITTEGLKDISFETFFNLVYTYADQ